MKVQLIREARIRHKPGEVVSVSPDEANFLISTGSAVPAPVAPKAGKGKNGGGSAVTSPDKGKEGAP